jgi:hypothetical protein
MIHEFLARFLKCKEKKAIKHKNCWQRTLKSTTAVLASIAVILLKIIIPCHQSCYKGSQV